MMRMKTETLSLWLVQCVLLGSCLVLASIIGALLVDVANHQIDRSRVERSAYETVCSNPNPLIVCRNGIVEIVNPAAEEALGVKQKDVIGTDVANSLITPEYRARHIAATAKLKLLPIGATGCSHYILPAIDARTGQQASWLVTAQYRRIENGDVITVARFVNYVLDGHTKWLDVETGRKVSIKVDIVPCEEG